MKTSERGIKFVAGFEGLSLVAYPDPGTGAQPYTIGFGSTVGVQKGDTITLEEAYDLLEQDVMHAEDVVNERVKVPLNQGEFDSLVSFVFNCGEGNFRKSTLLKLLNQMQYQQAAEQFVRWNRAGGQVMNGLTRRRQAERDLFLSGT